MDRLLSALFDPFTTVPQSLLLELSWSLFSLSDRCRIMPNGEQNDKDDDDDQ